MAASAQVIQFPQAQAQEPEQQLPLRGLSTLRRQFTNAVASKSAENQEAAESERYYHCAQWTDEELKTLSARNQPPIVFNRIKRKINIIGGIVEKLRQEPKAYPRNPNQASSDGAELATTALKYALGWRWPDTSSTVARRTAIRGISGVEMVVTPGDRGDPEIELDEVDQRDFFYDPRSTKHDFSDARFMGTSRWIDLDEAQDMFPDYREELESFVERGPTSDYDRGDERQKLAWLNKSERQVRVVDHWYKIGREWYYAIYCGETILEEGPSPFRDEKGRSTCKFRMLSWEVDHDNDRYGIVRDLKGPQDEINHRRSKALHALNSRQVIAEDGAVDDVDLARRELARNDGWVIRNPGRELEVQDAAKAQVVQGNLEMLQEAKQEIDTFGPNPGLIGTQVDAASGRAIQLLQAAGIAELGSFIIAYRHWKISVYRMVWCAIQQFWTSERWIRVGDDEEMAQFIQVNGWQQDEYGFPVAINQLAALDVDIIIDEGGDNINSMADTFDTLIMMAKSGMQVPPEVLFELSNIPSSTKKRIMAILSQGKEDPMQAQAIQLKLAQEQAELEETQSKATLNMARAQELLTPEQGGAQQQVDTPADLAKARLDEAKALEIEARVMRGDNNDPGLWEVQSARARRDHAAASREETRARNLAMFGAEEPAKVPQPRNGLNER